MLSAKALLTRLLCAYYPVTSTPKKDINSSKKPKSQKIPKSNPNRAIMIELDRIYNEDCMEGMKAIPDGSIDAERRQLTLC